MSYDIPFVSVSITEKENKYLGEAMQSGQLAGNGKFSKKCQALLEQYTGSACARMVTSCTAGLEMAVILAGIQPGDEIIMPSFTFVSTANAFLLFGGVPVFVDVHPETMNIDERLIEAAITPKTKVISPVHYAGVGCEMDTIMAIAKKHDLMVIEDAAQGLGSTYKGKPLGSIGDMSSISFHQTKNITAGGEGGAILVNNEALMERADIIFEKGTNRKRFFQGLVDKYTWVDIGSSFVLSDLLAAFLLAQLERLSDINADRMRQWNSFNNAFEALEGQGKARRPIIPEDCEHNAHIFYLLLNSADERKRCLEFLNKKGISAVFHYVPLHSSPAGIKFAKVASSMKNTDECSERLVRLPIWAGLPDEQHQFIIDTVFDFFS